MHILSSILFSISSNIDNLTVGISYGIKKTKIGILSNLIIACITALGTFLSMLIGKIIVKIISAYIANSLGSIILICIGIWFIIDFYIKENNKPSYESSKSGYQKLLDNPEIADADKSGYIDVKESIALAFALTINNLGVGIGASIAGLNIFATVFFTFIFSILFLSSGFFIGNSYLSKFFGKFAPLVSGAIVILLGVYEFFI